MILILFTINPYCVGIGHGLKHHTLTKNLISYITICKFEFIMLYYYEVDAIPTSGSLWAPVLKNFLAPGSTVVVPEAVNIRCCLSHEILHYYCKTAKNPKYEFDTDGKSETPVIRAKQYTVKPNLRQRDGTCRCVICNQISKEARNSNPFRKVNSKSILFLHTIDRNSKSSFNEVDRENMKSLLKYPDMFLNQEGRELKSKVTLQAEHYN